MSRSSRRKNKYEESGEDDWQEGTSARTRPCSFDEIMSRRRNKKLDENGKEGGGLGDVLGDRVSDRSGNAEGSNEHDKHYSFDVQLGLLEEPVKATSRKKEECISVKDEDLGKWRDRDIWDRRTKLKSIVSKDVGLDVEGKSDDKSNDRRKSDVRPRNYSKNQAGKKHSRDVIEKDRDRCVDGGRGKSERDNKRKYQTGIEEKNRERNSTKKHDARKGHELETSDRRERKELSKSHFQETSLKRRRSRSREHEDRHKRSSSLSPTTHKRSSYHGRGYEEVSSHSLKQKSGRQHSDAERSKISNNGSSSHHRRNGASTSGLGGYSPRKRRSEAAIKTPSPAKRSPDKKNAKWDLAPEGKDSVFSTLVPSSFQASNQNASSHIPEVASAALDASSTLKPLFGVSASAVLSNKNASMDSVQLTQATRPMRRLYVENVPASASEKSVMECLDNFLISSGVNHIHGTQPCISCIINKEKSLALVEFLTPEDATAALSFDGSSFSGSIIRIRRPKDFVDVASGEPEKSVPTVDTVSNVVKDSPHKIFIGGISKVLSSKMLMEIASAFGPLKAYQFETSKDLTDQCAYLEYADQSVTLKACAGLNGMKLGGQVITAVHAVTEVSPLESTGDLPLFGIAELAKPLLEKATHVLKLRNMLNPEVLSDAEIEEILEDVRLECARFGTVKSVNVVKCISNPIPASEACEVNDDIGSAYTQQNSVCDETNANTDISKEAIDQKILGGDSLDEKLAGDAIDDEPCQPGLACQVDSDVGDEAITRKSASGAGESPHEFCTSKDELHRSDDEVTTDGQLKDIISMDNKSMAGEELNFVEVSGEFKAVDDSVGMGLDSIENGDCKDQDCNVGRIFEAGCVFVEFARTEASCMAAHCLQGRLFDDRPVVVGYVPLDIYRARFPK